MSSSSAAPSQLEIYLGDVRAGTIVRVRAGETVFSFENSYIEDELRPTLSRGLIDAYGRLRIRIGRIGRILPFFANLLPEGDLRGYIAEHGGVDARDDFGMLWLTGTDLPGAVIARDPQRRTVPPVTAGGPSAGSRTGRLFRFSLAGVQLKFSALQNARGGLTIPISGRDGDYIVKLPSSQFSRVPENEAEMMEFARAVGLEVPECRLVDFSEIGGLPADIPAFAERKAFAVRRFDRGMAKSRTHIEDFNQIYRQYPDAKYDNHDYDEMARDIYRWIGEAALRDFVQRLIFTIAIGNTDMHLKNWSLIYRDGRTPELAPIYDYLCTSAYAIGGRNELALRLGGVKAFAIIGDSALENFARRADISPRIVLAAAREMRERITTTWPDRAPSLRETLPFVARRVDELLTKAPFFSDRR